jgi:hypothetical protein
MFAFYNAIARQTFGGLVPRCTHADTPHTDSNQRWSMVDLNTLLLLSMVVVGEVCCLQEGHRGGDLPALGFAG